LWLICGLGNPGPRYVRTRHNAGFWVVGDLTGEHRISLKASGTAAYGEGTIGGRPVVCLMPLTYMNNSGEALRWAAARWGVAPAEVLLVHDDVDLEPGAVRLRPGGGDGGHRGVRSVQQELGTGDIPRLRLGVGRPPPGVETADHVLLPPTAEERDLLAGAVRRAMDAVEAVVVLGLEPAMNRFNAPTA